MSLHDDSPAHSSPARAVEFARRHKTSHKYTKREACDSPGAAFGSKRKRKASMPEINRAVSISGAALVNEEKTFYGDVRSHSGLKSIACVNRCWGQSNVRE